MAAKSFSCGCCNVAKDHVMLARCYESNTPALCSPALANADSIFVSGCFTVANAHTIFAVLCAWKSLASRTAASASAAKGALCDLSALASAHATLARS
eukprot:gnl/TRDRNA2_/TRDRNA2_134299_c1_seq4.p2 gnl/TRDRNA2_/TRDRNA2_134299_c1~~gnl/TRDRNA2_/TRDRNA2_134299_c1_seq4.p2  ORF type:complete len:108 (-),score=12.66 gnl/TRDRNA2_/TRDRNA2_134299_c1_seq4:148-441(-)